jgi:transcriptional regulator with XRE-family HTH domain
MELEHDIGASSGYISRIENGEINPTKESVNLIATALRLNDKEVDYLIGNSFYPVSDLEIKSAQDDIKHYYSKKGIISYMVDDRKRLIAISDSFVKFLNIKDEVVERSIGKSFVSIILDRSIDIKSRIDPEKYNEILGHYLTKFYLDNSFMADDSYISQAIDSIVENEDSKPIWYELNKNSPRLLQTNENRFVVFKIWGFEFKLNYSIQPLLSNRRVDIIEYYPTNELLKLLAKVL